MGVKVRFWKGAWWIFANAGGRRKAKRIGDRETAVRVAQAIREKLARGELGLPTVAADQQTLRTYAESWLKNLASALKGSTLTFYGGALERYIYPAVGDR